MENEGQINKKLQLDETESLAAIFENEFMWHDDNTFSITLCNTHGNQFPLQVTLPETYPLDSPPKYEISAPWMERNLKRILHEELENIYCRCRGECVIYEWIDFIRDFIEEHPFHLAFKEDSVTDGLNDKKKGEIPFIAHGETISDRKSVFQAHLARVVSVKQVNEVLEKLKETRKIATATHNTYAYRIKCDENGTINQHCEDDGESKAGAVILHLLELLHLTNVVVIVTRWYGGIHLGHDRFKHYSNAAKKLINELRLEKDEERGKQATSSGK